MAVLSTVQLMAPCVGPIERRLEICREKAVRSSYPGHDSVCDDDDDDEDDDFLDLGSMQPQSETSELAQAADRVETSLPESGRATRCLLLVEVETTINRAHDRTMTGYVVRCCSQMIIRQQQDMGSACWRQHCGSL